MSEGGEGYNPKLDELNTGRESVSEAFERIQRAEVRGMPLSELVGKTDVDSLATQLRKKQAGVLGRPVTAEERKMEQRGIATEAQSVNNKIIENEIANRQAGNRNGPLTRRLNRNN